MKLASTPDWAERKAHTMVGDGATVTQGWLRKIIAEALRSERRRAVRKCRNIEQVYTSIGNYPQATVANDCATAIAGGK